MMTLTQENVHYTLNSGQALQGSCVDPGIFVRGGGVEARRPENSLDSVFLVINLFYSLQSGSKWFYYRGEEGLQLLLGGWGVQRNPYNL